MYSDDSDCVVLEEDPAESVKLRHGKRSYDSDDLVVVSEKGPVACRDYPHPRHLCVKFPFASTPHKNHCDRCHCYVCDSLAPCGFWGNGISRNNHCHANDKDELWKARRKSTKGSDVVQPIVHNRSSAVNVTPREPITFTNRDLPMCPHDGDALVISLCMSIRKVSVRRILVDTGSNVNVLYFDAFTKMGLTRHQLRLDRPHLADFSGTSVEAEGSILLHVEIGEYPRVKTMAMEFVVVDLESAYNGVLGQPGVCDLGGVISAHHLCMKFDTPNGVGVARGDQEMSRSEMIACENKDELWKARRKSTKGSDVVQPIVRNRSSAVHVTPREPITFTDRDLPMYSHDGDALVISLCMSIRKFDVRRILVDTGSNVNVLYFDAFTKMGLTRHQLCLDRPHLADFLGTSVEAEGSILLHVEIGEYPRVKTMAMEFVVVDLESAYNGILGQPGVSDLGGVISTHHLCMKFDTPNGVGVARGHQGMSRFCKMIACENKDELWKARRKSTKGSDVIQPIVHNRSSAVNVTPREAITFTDRDLPMYLHDGDALVISLCMSIRKVDVRRILVDTGSNVNVLYFDAFTKMGLTRHQLRLDRPHLADFLGTSVKAEGSILLHVEIGEYPRVKTMAMEFVVVDLESAYNGILGQPGVSDLGGVISTHHLCMKFDTPNGVGVARGHQGMSRFCKMIACENKDELWKARRKSTKGSDVIQPIVHNRSSAVNVTPREAITFTDRDLPMYLHDGDALVISLCMSIRKVDVRRILVDTGSNVNVLYFDAFTKMGLTRHQLRLDRPHLADFLGTSVEAEGSILLHVEIGEYPRVKTMAMEFVVVDLESAYNGILGQPGVSDLGGVISTHHLCMKFDTPNGVGVARGDQEMARICEMIACENIGKRCLHINSVSRIYPVTRPRFCD